MRIKWLIFLSFIQILFNPYITTAAPVLFDPRPPSGSYSQGGLVTFSINISDITLNDSDVRFYIKAWEETDPNAWDEHYLSCRKYTSSDWYCNKTISLIIVGDDTMEAYYFNVSSKSGEYSWLGTRDNPLNMTVDINPPIITSVNVENYSYISPNKNIKVDVTDKSSGVNKTSVISLMDYLYGNLTWNSTWKPMIYVEPYFIADWNTSNLPNNSTWSFFVNATDNIGNSNETKLLDVLIDKEFPSLTVNQPSPHQLLQGTAKLNVTVRDEYSGVDSSKISFKVESPTIEKNMECVGSTHEYECTGYFDTTTLPDGIHTITFTIFDNAENSRNESIQVEIDNTRPYVEITDPLNNTYTNVDLIVRAKVNNPGTIVRNVKFRWEKMGSYGEWVNMTCSETFDCSYLWNTSELTEDVYKITVDVINDFDYKINDSILITLDRTKPDIAIDLPKEFFLKGSFNSSVIVTDTFGVNMGSVEFEISNYSGTMNCVESIAGKKYICRSTFDSEKLNDGPYSLTFTVKDLAQNENSVSSEISIDNFPPYLKNLKIDPLTSENPTLFTFKALIEDLGSYVSSVSLTISYKDGSNENLTMYYSPPFWSVDKYVDKTGIHSLNLTLTDFMNNTLDVKNVGYFYVGHLGCGNGICEDPENYCICAKDCDPPTCSPEEVLICDSGFPKCERDTFCGDGFCGWNETCISCELDCGKCSGIYQNISYEITTTMAEPLTFVTSTITENKTTYTYVENKLSTLRNTIVNNIKKIFKLSTNMTLLIILTTVLCTLVIIIWYYKTRKVRIIETPPEVISVGDVETIFDKEKSKLQLVYNFILSALDENDIYAIRMNIENALLYLNQMREKSFIKEKILSTFKSIKIEPLQIELKRFLEKNFEQIYRDEFGNEVSRKQFIKKINDNLFETMKTTDMRIIQENLNRAKHICEEFDEFFMREITFWYNYTNLVKHKLKHVNEYGDENKIDTNNLSKS